MGRVTEMRAIRSALLAIVVAVTLIGGTTTPADAKSLSNKHVVVVVSGPGTSGTMDPGDPGLPPD
ncbi:MAG: hypothetical protein QOH08_2393 [Chloroflexota bacterium]|jgi:hypothetical protein|nr:hypothetical protein [Chloroflexota bacterium]